MTLRLSQLPKLSGQLKNSILTQIKESERSKAMQRINNNIAHIHKSEKEVQNPIPEQTSKLAYNIVLEFLRSHDLNYTYNILVSEAHFPLKDVVYPEDLRRLLSIHETDIQIRKHTMHKYSVLDVMIEQLQRVGCEKTSSSTQTFAIDDSVSLEEMFNKKYERMKEELSRIYEDDYRHKQKVQFVSPSQQQQLKEDLKLEFQQEYQNRYKAKSKLLQAKQEAFKRKQTEFLKQYNAKLSDIKSENQRIRAQSTSLKQRLKDSLHQLSIHRCSENQEYKKMLDQMRVQKFKVKDLQTKYQLALSNLNTRVEDIIAQKQQIVSQNKNLDLNIEKRRRLDDVTSKKLLVSIKNLEERVGMLSKDNMLKSKQEDVKNRQIVYLEKELKHLQEQLVQEQSLSSRMVELHNNRVITKSVSTNVNEKQIHADTHVKTESDRQAEQQQIRALIEESNKNRLNYFNNMDRINIEMNFIKDKVRDLVDDSDLY